MVSYSNSFDAIIGSFYGSFDDRFPANDILTFGGKTNKKTRSAITGSDEDAENFMKQFIIKKVGKSKQSEVLSNVQNENPESNLVELPKLPELPELPKPVTTEPAMEEELFENAEAIEEKIDNEENENGNENKNENLMESSDSELFETKDDLFEDKKPKNPEKPKNPGKSKKQKKVKFAENTENIKQGESEVFIDPSDYFETYDGSKESKKDKNKEDKEELEAEIESKDNITNDDNTDNIKVNVKDDYAARIDEIVEKYSEYLK